MGKALFIVLLINTVFVGGEAISEPSTKSTIVKFSEVVTVGLSGVGHSVFGKYDADTGELLGYTSDYCTQKEDAADSGICRVYLKNIYHVQGGGVSLEKSDRLGDEEWPNINVEGLKALELARDPSDPLLTLDERMIGDETFRVRLDYGIHFDPETMPSSFPGLVGLDLFAEYQGRRFPLLSWKSGHIVRYEVLWHVGHKMRVRIDGASCGNVCGAGFGLYDISVVQD